MNPYIDPDPDETAEWMDAFNALVRAHGAERGHRMLAELQRLAGTTSATMPAANTPYLNTVHVNDQPAFAGDLAMEQKIASLMRWNALAMVVRANQAYGELGGHVASYASAADLFEVGFNHFFKARAASGTAIDRGDLVFFQPHSAPGIYARAFLEGRLSENDLDYFRRELAGHREGTRGLPSYPHPYLMPDFWQFPTGSMGIGPINSIYQARFMRYLTHRGLLDCAGRRVWGVFGDGEMDEPESMSALTLAARENLDNLTWVINCNLQRLDGPVRGNGRIIDELERLFKGAGWHVVKLIWGSDWDDLFAMDHDGALEAALARTVDGEMQTFAANDGAFNRKKFFGQNEALTRLAEQLSDDQIDALKRGGHDLTKIYAAYLLASKHQGQPTVILAHTKKGYGMGASGQGRMTTHSHKKFESSDLLAFRDRFALPLNDEQTEQLAFYKPAADSPEIQYLQQRRRALGGYLPQRYQQARAFATPDIDRFARFAVQADGKEMSTTMAFVRMLGTLLKDETIGARIVPIVADEARTFGMANLFKQIGIYASQGQRYEPEDIGSILSYREARDGQILEEGISEAGAISSWTAAATSYSVHGEPMLPFYIYYSMFGFQRVGDLIWAAADQRPRGFLIGATSGRTTLGGEGLQHQDGTSHLWAATIPNCKAYDPAHAGELAVIVERGMRDMLHDQKDVFYYVTVMNENAAQPSLDPAHCEDVMRGCYLLETHTATPNARAVTLMASGAILGEARKAAQSLAHGGLTVYVYSVTSWSELARDARSEGLAAQGQTSEAPAGFLAAQLARSAGPVIAATDYVCLVPESVRAFVPADRRYVTLGTDGFGRSDTRAELRRFFGVDAQAIAEAARQALGI